MTNYIQNGDSIDVNIASAITSGQLVTVGELVGVAQNTTATGIDNVIAICGVYEVPKATGAITFGAKLYHDTATGNVTTTAGSLKLAGYAVSAQLSGDATVKLKLLF